MNDYYGIFDYKESDTFRPTLQDRIHKDYPYSKTICTTDKSCCVMSGGGYNLMDLKIRKLTPKECFRLMGVKDEDIDKLKYSDATLYHLAGDSIVVNVLMAIFKEVL